MVGLDARATMDIDATIKGTDVNVEAVERIIADIVSVLLEERSIDVWTYNLETVLAEKLETVISRNITNTRMRDFYDIHILLKLYGNTLDAQVLGEALQTTAKKRETERYLNDAIEIFNEVQNDFSMQKLWNAYHKKFSYAEDISWDMVMESIRELYCMSVG